MKRVGLVGKGSDENSLARRGRGGYAHNAVTGEQHCSASPFQKFTAMDFSSHMLQYASEISRRAPFFPPSMQFVNPHIALKKTRLRSLPLRTEQRLTATHASANGGFSLCNGYQPSRPSVKWRIAIGCVGGIPRDDVKAARGMNCDKPKA